MADDNSVIMDGDIGALGNNCIGGFEELIQSLSTCSEELNKDMPLMAVENEFSRFKIWCGNLGALQRGKSSLDVRLRGSTVIREAVFKFLGQLLDSLTQSVEVTTGARPPWEKNLLSEDTENDSFDESDGDSDTSCNELRERLVDIQDTIAHLYRLSFKMRNATYRSLSSKALSLKFPDPETGEDLFSHYATFDYQYVLESLHQLRKPPHSPGDSESAQKSDDDIPAFLLNRLSRAITNRRRYFAYWQRHALKLSLVMSENAEKPKAELLKRMNLMSISGPRTLPISETDVSKYRRSLDDRLDSQTFISYATTAKDTEGNSVDLPPPPADASSKPEFICNYCWVVCPSREGRGKQWRAHILQDLQPYVCTFQDCLEGDHLYSSRRAWMEHERLQHCRVWRCFDKRHSNMLYKSKEELSIHFSKNHDGLTESQIQILLDLTETTVADARRACPFCNSAGPFDKGLHNHMAFHQERLASFAAPRNVGDDDRDEEFRSGMAKGVRSATSLRSVSLKFSDASNLSKIITDPITKPEEQETLPTVEREREKLESLLGELGPDHPDTLACFSRLGSALSNQESYEEAEVIYRRALEGYEKIRPEHPDILATLSGFGWALYKQENYEEALTAFRRALDGYEKIGSKHPDTLATLSGLGRALSKLGNYEEAEVMSRRALEGYKKLEPRHPGTLSTLTDLGWVLICQNNYGEAKTVFRQVLEGYKEMSPEHPGVFATFLNLGWVYCGQKKHKKAETMYRRALEGCEKVHGPEHPDTLGSAQLLSETLHHQGKYEEAEAIQRRVLEGFRRSLGSEHLDTLEGARIFSTILFKQGKKEEAELICRQALEGYKKVMGPEYRDTLWSATTLSEILSSQGKNEEAELICRGASESYEKVMGPDHRDTLWNFIILSQILFSQGKYEDAEVISRRTLDDYERVLGPEYRHTIRCAIILSEILSNQGKDEEAEAVRQHYGIDQPQE